VSFPSSAGPSVPERVVVAGAGLAGLRTAEELRARGYAGEVTLVGAERRPPYDRPPLSKRVMAGELADTTLRDDLDTLGIRLHLAETATGFEPGAGEPDGGHHGGVLRTDRGEHRYDRLVLATGATPVSGSCARSTTRWPCGTCSNPGGGWPSWGRAGSVPSWPRPRPPEAAR
jgi:NADPH-dependent 2,4-dienoyl-CoA reductase/sulfur reductase-like enzyme